MSFRPFTFSDYIQLYMNPSIKTISFTAKELQSLKKLVSSAMFKIETTLEETRTLLDIESKLSSGTCPACGSPIPQKEERFTVDHNPDTHRYIVKTHLGTTIKSFIYIAEVNSSKVSAFLEAHQLCDLLNR